LEGQHEEASALDRHTARGRAKRRGWKHFWEEGALLGNPAPVPDAYAAKAREIRQDRQIEFEL